MWLLNAHAETSPVLVRFSNGEQISERDLSQYLDRRLDMRQQGRNSWGVETVVSEMALTRTLILEGEAMGELRRTEERHRFDDKVGLAIYKKLMPACEPPADEAATRRFYDQNQQAFQVPPTVRLNRVMLPTKEVVDGEPAGGWLLSQAQAIASGGKKFEEVALRAAKLHKIDPQGDLGWVALTGEVPILRALTDAGQGDLVGPVPEGDFVYLFQIIGKRDGRILRWDEVATSAAGRAVRYCREQGSEQLRDSLFEKYGVKLDRPAIRALFSRHETKQ